MFGLGAVVFKLLSGERPFPGNNKEIRRRTLALRYDVRGSNWNVISSSAKDLIRHLLIHRDERLTAENALKHAWFDELGQSVLHATTMVTNDDRSNAMVRVRINFCALQQMLSHFPIVPCFH